MNLKILVILILFNNFLLFTQMPLYIIETDPHPNFITKHICKTCITLEDVEKFAAASYAARVANGWTLTKLNTVFVTSDMVYLTDDLRTWIVFKFPAKQYSCRCGADTKVWKCFQKGSVRAKHSPDRGHYEYKEDFL